jgi:enoyl-CoA hydratase/carnithine racemase
MSTRKANGSSSSSVPVGVIIERGKDVLTFTLDNTEHGNEVTGPMFDAMLAELHAEASQPSARVLRIRARGKVFCTGRERAGRDVAAIRHESARILDFKTGFANNAIDQRRGSPRGSLRFRLRARDPV